MASLSDAELKAMDQDERVKALAGAPTLLVPDGAHPSINHGFAD